MDAVDPFDNWWSNRWSFFCNRQWNGMKFPNLVINQETFLARNWMYWRYWFWIGSTCCFLMHINFGYVNRALWETSPGASFHATQLSINPTWSWQHSDTGRTWTNPFHLFLSIFHYELLEPTWKQCQHTHRTGTHWQPLRHPTWLPKAE